MKRIVGIAGSLRKASLNAALLRAAADVVPASVRVEVGDIAGIPLYNGDTEDAAGLPEPVIRLKDQLAAADGIIFVTPEYNGSIPGVMKNATDWLSRPADDIPRVFGGKPVAIMGATMGRLGTIRAQQAWLPVLKAFRTRPWFAQDMLVSQAHELFDAEGRLTDEATRARLARFLQGFVEFIG